MVSLRFPGCFPSVNPPTDKQAMPSQADEDVGMLILALESALLDSVVSLNLYENALSILSQRRLAVQAQMAAIREEREDIREMKNAMNAGPSFPGLEGAPKAQADRYLSLCAIMFLYSVDRTMKLFGRLQEDGHLNPAGLAAFQKLKAELPGVRFARNSTAHMEDRIVGKGMHGAPIPVKPVDTPLFKSTGEEQAILLENINGGRFGSTDQKGNISEIEISAKTIESLRVAIQAVIDTYHWIGPPRES